jgi:hypothetical protein
MKKQIYLIATLYSMHISIYAADEIPSGVNDQETAHPTIVVDRSDSAVDKVTDGAMKRLMRFRQGTPAPVAPTQGGAMSDVSADSAGKGAYTLRKTPAFCNERLWVSAGEQVAAGIMRVVSGDILESHGASSVCTPTSAQGLSVPIVESPTKVHDPTDASAVESGGVQMSMKGEGPCFARDGSAFSAVGSGAQAASAGEGSKVESPITLYEKKARIAIMKCKLAKSSPFAALY